MKRRQFIQTSGAATAATALGDAAEGARPNLVIVHCDELNFRTLGCYRNTLPPEQAFMWGPNAVCDTPHIDTLAREGALCTKFYAATPVCSPSRSSLISGRYPQNTPVTNNNVSLADGIRTFAHQLGDAGYTTGYAGKWHLDGHGKPQWQPERKFGFQDNRFMFNRGHWKKFELTEAGPRVAARDKKGAPGYAVDGADETSFATDWLTDRCIDFIDEHQHGPFAYMLSIPDPHGPDTVRAPYDSLFRDDDIATPRTYHKSREGVPSWALPQEKCPCKMASYHGMIKCIDDNVGKLVASLKERGLYDDTILIFTADHGDMRGEHHRQNKGVPMEASAKIPFVIRWPKRIPADLQIDHAMNTTDFAPTILAMMETDPTGEEEGRDLSSVFAGGEFKGDDVTFMRGTNESSESTKGWIAAVTPTHKLVLSDQDEAWLLDLENDPDELVNCVDESEQAETRKFLAAHLVSYGQRCRDRKLSDPHISKTLQDLL